MADRLTVAEAGLCLGMGWHAVVTRVMRGELTGGRDPFGWWVSRAAVQRALAERGETQKPPTTGEPTPAA